MGDLVSDRIAALARRSAASGLKLRQAVSLFEALYAADCLVVSKGNVTRAAEVAGVNRECFQRRFVVSRGRRSPDADPT